MTILIETARLLFIAMCMSAVFVALFAIHLGVVS